MSLADDIHATRSSCVAVLRYWQTKPPKLKNGKLQPAQYGVGWGSGFCVVENRYIVTAHHILNNGQPRRKGDSFVAFVVPENGATAFHFPVVGFPCERVDCDTALLELGPCATAGVDLPAIPVRFTVPPDGSRVVTVGFPSPEVQGISVDEHGVYRGGSFFLKSHANEGIISAQYEFGGLETVEFNVGWHHGESGGPVVVRGEPRAAFTLMQHYRNIQGPHAVMAGPHRGRTLKAIEAELRSVGATVA